MLELKQKPQFNIQLPPRMLEEGYLVYFPTTWPSTYNNVRGQMFQVSVAKQMPYDIPYIIPGGDYRDVDFSNGGGTFQETSTPRTMLPWNKSASVSKKAISWPSSSSRPIPPTTIWNTPA